MRRRTKTIVALFEGAVARFRSGADREGLALFLDGIHRLKGLLVPDGGMDDEGIIALHTASEKLLVCMENGDVCGLTDVLESSVCPALRLRGEGDGAHESGQ